MIEYKVKRYKPLFLSGVLLLAQVTFVAPFVVANGGTGGSSALPKGGSTAGTSSVIASTVPPHQQSSTTPTTSIQAVYQNIDNVVARSKSSTSLHMSSSLTPTENEESKQTKKRLKLKSIRALLSKIKLKRTSHNDNDNWKGGEVNATLPSKLLFRYASPLVNLASERNLVMDDAFVIPSKQRMGSVVSELSQIYTRQSRKARKRTEQLKVWNEEETAAAAAATKQPQKNTKVQTSQSLILLKSLLIHQKSYLIYTGVLRLVNTCVQAFPAVMVSRLLRYLEAGKSYPPSKALGSALMLVGILLVKMITENQYFHHITKMATVVRGSVAGLIFDKSLKLSSSSSSTTTESKSNGKEGDKESDDNAPPKNKSKQNLGVGEVLNLMQADASMLEFTTMQLHTIWDGPLQIAIYTTLLFKYLGKSVYYGIGVLLMTIPINSVTLRLLNRLSKYELEAKDQRTKRTTEAISNMKLLKLQGWESTFQQNIQHYRVQELQRHVTRGIVRALNQAISNAVPALTLVVTLTAYSKSGRPIVASTIFTAISLFNQLRFPLFFYPMLIDSLANGKNAMRRISSYLSTEEITPYIQELAPLDINGDGGSGGGSITMKNGNFLWSKTKQSKSKKKDTTKITTPSVPALSNINLDIKPGEVVAVIGTVGSGKTALIKSLLGELIPVPRIVVDQTTEQEEGDLAVLHQQAGMANGSDGSSNSISSIMDKPEVITHGDTAYCSQEAWLPKGTIRDAVVFGREYNETKYIAALYDAGLDADIVNDSESASSSNNGVLSHDTDVGEGGSSLSGGQRARVALARALYDCDETSKVYLLDDPLAALDASVGATVFERITKRLRRANAATVLVTNDPSLPRRCDKVILMGKCSESSSAAATTASSSSPSCSTILDVGTYDELIARGHDIKTIKHEEDELQHRHADKKETNVVSSSTAASHQKGESTRRKQPQIIAAHNDEEEEGIQIIGVGGYAIPSNDTIRTCHADPDRQACKDIDKFPDHVADHAEVISPDTPSADDVIYSKNSQINHKSRKEKTTEISVPSDQSSSSSTTKKKERLASADDSMSTGAVPLSTYVTYLKSVRKPMLIVAMLASYLLATGAQFFQQFIVAKWTEIGKGDAMAVALGLKYLRSLINAAGVVSVFLWLRSFLTMKVGTRASEFLHNNMLTSVFRAPMSFFDATPSGQLLSRFGKEMEIVDRSLPDGIGSVLFCFLQIGLSGLALAGVITPAMALPLGVIGVLYYNTMNRFRPAARDLKREESKSRSPIYTHFGEALRGSEIIRSIPSAKANWSSEHQRLTDMNLSVFSSVKALDRWLSLRLESLGNVVVLAAAIASVILTRMGRLKAGSAGWGLTQALAITGLMTWAVRTLTDLETYMMSVMRVKELTALDSDEVETGEADSMPHELSAAGEALAALYKNSTALNMSVAPTTDKALVRDGWPWKGGIAFKEVSMRYNAISPLVLNNVTIDVPPGTTLGVVGRTGSGKSSLLVTLFRLVEIEKGRGSIDIDGVDIRSISLQTLRESLSIIPQDPVLFEGTIMYNLDATGKASEVDAWAALEAASPELAAQFRNNGKGLNTQVNEGGKNLSSGQRQLLCLARALLRKNKILVLDEATSSVDSKTDAQVQATIQKEFVQKGVTVITVAHRLDTILGYDKIAVLGNGKLVEYGTPNELLKNRSGELRRLVDADRQNKLKGSLKDKSLEETPIVMA